jgi:amino acid permease
VNLIAVSILVCTIKNVGIIFDIGGAVTANSIVVILPTAFYYKLMILNKPNGDVENSTEPLVEKKKTNRGPMGKLLETVSHYIYPFVTGAGLALMVVMLGKIVMNSIE